MAKNTQQKHVDLMTHFNRLAYRSSELGEDLFAVYKKKHPKDIFPVEIPTSALCQLILSSTVGISDDVVYKGAPVSAIDTLIDKFHALHDRHTELDDLMGETPRQKIERYFDFSDQDPFISGVMAANLGRPEYLEALLKKNVSEKSLMTALALQESNNLRDGAVVLLKRALTLVRNNIPMTTTVH